MLQQIFQFLIISFICILWGLPVLFVAERLKETFSRWFTDIAGLLVFLFFNGLLLLSLLTSWLCLFFPVNFLMLAASTGLLVAFLFIKRKEITGIVKKMPTDFNFSVIDCAFILICFLIFIVAGTLKPSNSDTLIYHVQIIKWFNEYGTVPGIANLFPRYGLGSNWFNLAGLFRLPIFTFENFSWLNTAMAFWFFIWLITKWKYHSLATTRSSSSLVLSHYYFLVLLFALFEWEMLRDAANSTNYDFIVTALTLIAVSYLFETILISPEHESFSLLFIFLTLSIIPFKLSGVFTGLLVLIYLIWQKKIKYFAATIVIALLVIIPFLIKNYIATGYPLYPVVLKTGSPDWQVPAPVADYMRQYIHVTNRFYNSRNVNYTKLPELMQQDWIRDWLHGLLLQQKAIAFASLGSLAILFYRVRYYSFNHNKLRLLFIVLLLMGLIWFFSAPSLRFGYGFMLPLAFFPVCYYAGRYFPVVLHQPVLILTLFILCYYLYKKSEPIRSRPEFVVHVMPLETPPVNEINIGGTKFYLPHYYKNGWMRDCYGTELPCIYQLNPYLNPRGTTLKEGFKMEKPDSSFIRNYIY